MGQQREELSSQSRMQWEWNTCFPSHASMVSFSPADMEHKQMAHCWPESAVAMNVFDTWDMAASSTAERTMRRQVCELSERACLRTRASVLADLCECVRVPQRLELVLGTLCADFSGNISRVFVQGFACRRSSRS